ncbi:fungal-specific transcription factor domain-containing protein [Lipomyces kononenkoae]
MLSATINGYATSTMTIPHFSCAEDTPSHQLPQLNDRHACTAAASIQNSAIQTKVSRRRISRACDQCNRFRTRCDGNQPCKRCSDHSLNCDYARQIKKRGKGSQRYTYKSTTRVTKQMNSLEDENLTGSRSSVSPTRKDSLNGGERIVIARNNGSAQSNATDESSEVNNLQHPFMDLNSINAGRDNGRQKFAIIDVDLGSLSGSGSERMDQSSPGSHQNDQYSPTRSSSELRGESLNMRPNTAIDNLSEILSSSLVDVSSSARTSQAMVGNDHVGIGNPTDGVTPCLQILSPYLESLSTTAAASRESGKIQPLANSGCKYSILDPILPSLEIIPPSLAGHLLELYFTNTIYGIAHFVRKSSILRRDGTGRVCSRALLYSFLYVAAHASDHPVIIATPTSRTDIIIKLRDLIMEHMHPLKHDDSQGTLDDVMTYIHLGIISSASEFKGGSLRWWHAAWGLARVLKLNVEALKSKTDFGPAASGALGSLTEETREERRRVWWLLFMVDRHLALCYNRPISVVEHESRDVYQPCSDELWHSDAELISAEIDPSRLKGLSYRVTGSDVWGYFLPLMTLLGGIDDLHQLELSSTLAASPDMIGPVRDDLRRKLDEFSQSIEELGDIGPPSILFKGNDFITNGFGGSVTKRPMSLRTCWKEYCRCLIHVFHILLSGYWDPLDVLTVPSAVVLNDEFVNVIQHSLDFAKCVKNILEVDHDLRLIPFFFGIYLLQGSFLLLYIVDVLLDRDVRAACETIVRAHEVCIVTLNTDYQRNFRQIMRSALLMIDEVEEFQRNPHIYDGSPPKDAFLTEIEENKSRRKALLSFYRWSQGGNGLAV